jgi:hypothetical protein
MTNKVHLLKISRFIYAQEIASNGLGSKTFSHNYSLYKSDERFYKLYVPDSIFYFTSCNNGSYIEPLRRPLLHPTAVETGGSS